MLHTAISTPSLVVSRRGSCSARRFCEPNRVPRVGVAAADGLAVILLFVCDLFGCRGGDRGGSRHRRSDAPKCHLHGVGDDCSMFRRFDSVGNLRLRCARQQLRVRAGLPAGLLTLRRAYPCIVTGDEDLELVPNMQPCRQRRLLLVRVREDSALTSCGQVDQSALNRGDCRLHARSTARTRPGVSGAVGSGHWGRWRSRREGRRRGARLLLRASAGGGRGSRSEAGSAGTVGLLARRLCGVAAPSAVPEADRRT